MVAEPPDETPCLLWPVCRKWLLGGISMFFVRGRFLRTLFVLSSLVTTVWRACNSALTVLTSVGKTPPPPTRFPGTLLQFLMAPIHSRLSHAMGQETKLCPPPSQSR